MAEIVDVAAIVNNAKKVLSERVRGLYNCTMKPWRFSS